jgi:hypothetical protein
VQSGNGIIRALSPYYRFKLFTKHEIESDFFDNVDMVCLPGGIGDSDSFSNLFKTNGDAVRSFVQRGGKYLGICMGAYWADHNYFGFLEDTEAQQYIRQPSTCTRRPHAKAMKVNWKGESQRMFFYDGPTFKGGSFETVATYPNGDPMAIVQGRLGLIGCHPESEEHWYKYYSWMRGLYHDGIHHKLLLGFVRELMEK